MMTTAATFGEDGTLFFLSFVDGRKKCVLRSHNSGWLLSLVSHQNNQHTIDCIMWCT